MKSLLRIVFVAVSSLLWMSANSQQSILGGNITWECLGSNTYEITMTFYRDCYGSIGEVDSYSMDFYSADCGLAKVSNVFLTSNVEISDLCATELPNSSCGTSGFAPGTMQVVYVGTITLDPGCTWEVVFHSFDLFIPYENMDIVFNQPVYLHTIIDTTQPCGDSPDVISTPANPQIPYICINTPYTHNSFLSLPAGYSAVYSLTDVLTPGATNDVSVPASGYSLPSGMTINPITGIINWTPTALGYYGVSVQMEIYNGANYVGTMFENMTFLVRSCTPTVTSFEIPQVTSYGSDVTLTGNNNIGVCVGDSIVFTVEASNPELTRTITLSYTPIGAIPLTFTQTGVNPAIGTFTGIATSSMVSGIPYALQISAIDDACPNPDTDNIVVNITVSPNVHLLTNDTTICKGQTVNLAATGLNTNNYNWNVLMPGGDNTPPPTNTVSSQNVTPDFTTSYRVSATGIPATCASSDTVTVTVALTDVTLIPMTETCGNNNGAIDMTILGDGSGNYDIQWTGTNSVDQQQDQFGLNGGTGLNYTVIVTDNVYGCVLYDSVNVGNVAPPALTFYNDTIICLGGSASLLLDFSAGVAPFDIDFDGTPADVNNVPDGFTFNMSPTSTATYTILNVTDNTGCTAAVNQSVTITVRQPVTSNFLPEADICVGANLILDVNHGQAGTYEVLYSINGVNQAPINVADNGTLDVPNPSTSGTFTYDIESISYIDSPNPACPSNDAANPSIQVIVDPLPTAVLSGNATFCAGDCYDQTITLTGTGPWVVGYTLNGTPQTALNIPNAVSPHDYTWNVCVAGTYCLTSVQDANCTNTVTGECATLTSAPLPVVSFTIPDTELCTGDCVNGGITVTPAGNTFTAVFHETPNDVNFNSIYSNQNSPFTPSLCPQTTTSYCLDSVYFTGVGQCATQVNQCITLNVNGDITVTPVDTICDNTSTNYQVVFEITGGEQQYYEDPAGAGGSFDVATHTFFTTNNVLSGLGGGPWVFGDNNDCNSVSMTMSAYTCPVLSDAGTMNLTPITVCGNTPITGIWNNDGFLDGNDQQMFILHTTAGSTLGTVISTDCNDATFGDADSPLAFGAFAGAGTIVSGTTYYISSVVGNNDGSNDCVATAAPNVQISPGVPVKWNAIPQVNFTINHLELCEDSCALVHVTVSPTGPFNIRFTETPDDPGLGAANGQNSPFDYNVCPDASTQYCLDSVYFVGVPQCAATPNQCISVNVNTGVSVVPSDTICNNISTQYQIVYSISSGELPYDENPLGANGTFDGTGTQFTTSWVNSGTAGGPWVFSDVNDCNSVSVSMPAYNCPVITDPGTMSNQLIAVCGGTTNANTAIGVYNNDAVLDGNDEQMFILHTTAGGTLGTVIATDCNDATFGDADSPLTFGPVGPGVITSGTIYYISSVAGDGSGVGVGGCVNTSAPNVQISAGQPVIWYQEGTAVLTAVADTDACQGQNVQLQIALTGQGPWTVEYIRDNDPLTQTTVTVPVGGSPYIFNVSVSGQYCLLSVNNSPANCPGTASGCVDVVIHPLPTAVLSASAEICSGEVHCFDIDFTGESPWSVIINDPDAIDETIPATANNPYQYCVSAAGPYRINSVTDGFGCINNTDGPIVNLTVNSLPTIQWSFAADTSFCEGTCIDLTMASTGESTFDVTIISPDPNITTASLQNIGQVHTITICEPGSYELVEVTDNNGCVSVGGDIIQVDEIPTPVANAGPDLDQCVNLPITIGTAAVAGQTYSWAPTTGFGGGQSTLAQPTLTVASANTYNYTVTASVAQCSATDQMTLTVHALPVISINAIDDSLCYDTCTDLTASGADNYAWTASPSINGALNTATITVCPASTETFTVTGYETHNAIQCQATKTQTIVMGDELILNLDFSDEVCFGTCDGFASFDITGGFAPYEVNGDLATEWTDLCDGVYNYVVTDEQGCEIASSFTINERPQEIIDQMTFVNPTCFEDITGSIQLTDAAATSFSLDAPAGVPDVLDNLAPFEFTNLPVGDYIIYMSVEVEPGIVCAADTTLTLTSLSPEYTIGLDWTQQSFCFGDEVCVEANLVGGFGGQIAHWNSCEGANGCELSTANPYCFTITQDSTLYVYGTDQNLCSTDTLSITAALYPDISFNFLSTIDTVICQFECTELITQVSGGNGNVFVDWYEIPVDNTPFFTGNTVEVCPFTNTTYWIEANDGCSESVRDTITITVHETPIPLFETDTLEGCYPATIQFYDLTIPINDDYTCLWSFGDNGTLAFCGDNSYAYPDFGDFYPSLTLTTEYGCVGSDTLDQAVVIHGYPEIDFTWNPQPVTVLEHEVQFTNLTTGAVSYNWNFYFTGTSQEVDPFWDFPDLDQADFPVCLEATSAFGCVDTLCQDIFIESILEVFVPNSFTPDGDGINDVFIPVVSGVKPASYKFWIFNRWGDPVFYTDVVGKAWTGGSDNGEYYIEDGTYVWRMECEPLQDNKVEVFEGHVTILR